VPRRGPSSVLEPCVEPSLTSSRPEVHREREAHPRRDLIKAKGVSRDDVEAAISSLFDGRPPSPSERECTRSSCPISPR
jgi:hypothetical protein